MRTENSLKNIFVSLSLGFALVVINFVAQKIFVETLGIEYLGLNGLFLNIISMLSIAELGLGSAIIYHLYAPLRSRDTSTVSSLMRFYKKSYRAIALIIITLGTLSLPFLPLLVGENQLTINIQLAYMLFVANAAASYLLSYKRSILHADQKNYIVDFVHFGTLVALNTLQIWILIATQNYYLFLVIRLVATIIENLVINGIVDRRYVIDRDAKPIEKELRTDIITKLKGLLFHKIAQFAVLGTDSILISVFFGVRVVGLYSNYLLVLTALNTIFSQLSNSLTASVGSLLLDKNTAKQIAVFKNVYFANFWLSTVAAVGFLVVVNSFISLWLGSQYLFSIPIVAAITASLYLSMLRMPIQTFKTAAGIFYEDRFMPILEAAINLVLSLILLHVFGVMGVFLGTICSTLFLHLYSYPKYTYTKLFDKQWSEYWLLIAKSIVIAAPIAAVAYYVSIQLISEQQAWLQLGWSMLIGLVLPNIVLYVIYRKTDEYAYFLSLTKSGAKKMFDLIKNVRIRK